MMKERKNRWRDSYIARAMPVAREIVEQCGASRLTPGRLAMATDAYRKTVTRIWPNRAALVAYTVAYWRERGVEIDTSDLVAELRAMLDGMERSGRDD
jgi:hypothetical protein